MADHEKTIEDITAILLKHGYEPSDDDDIVSAVQDMTNDLDHLRTALEETDQALSVAVKVCEDNRHTNEMLLSQPPQNAVARALGDILRPTLRRVQASLGRAKSS